MAKRSSGASTFNKVLASIPSEADFEITMAADSTTEVWVDIDTGIDDGEAWVIYGMEYVLEVITPTVPIDWTAAAGNEFVLQVHRNDDHELLINSNDDDLLMQDRFAYAASSATGDYAYNNVRRVVKRTITMQPTLRAIFRSQVDSGPYNATTNQIAGKILYDKIKAPNIGVSKIGLIANL